MALNTAPSSRPSRRLRRPRQVRETSPDVAILTPGVPEPGLFKRVSARELTYFTSQLSLMLEVGTSLGDALRATSKQAVNEYFRAIQIKMLDDVETGRQLSEAMGRFPKVFDGVFRSMVRAGEAGGFLNETLNRIVEMQEKRQDLLNQLRAALAYPIILCVLASVVIVFIIVGVLPKFTAFFAGKEALLPVTTRFLMAASHSIRTFWYAYIVGAVGLAVGIKLFVASPLGSRSKDAFLVRAPLIRPLATKIYTCQLLRVLGNLLESHVPLLEALPVTRATMRNRHYQHFVDEIAANVREGGRLSQAFAANPHIMESVRQMIATGEEVGNLYTVMLRLAKFYDKEVDNEIKTVASLVEPAALLIIGGIIGTIVASVILPMFKLAQAVH